MLLDYHQWVSRNANTIEDKSYHKRSACSHSEMQVRSMLASLLIPVLETDDDAYRWMTAFCIAVTPVGTLKREATMIVIGAYKNQEWYDSEDELAWVRQFKKDIENGWGPQ